MAKMTIIPDNYNNIRAEIVELLRAARSTAARTVNSIMTATYWEIGRRFVEQELKGDRLRVQQSSPPLALPFTHTHSSVRPTADQPAGGKKSGEY